MSSGVYKRTSYNRQKISISKKGIRPKNYELFMSKLTICAFSSMGYQSAAMLAESCTYYGYRLDYQDYKFVNYRQFKIDFLIDYFSGINSKYVMYTDACDSWMLKPRILDKFHFFGSDVVVSGNRDFYPANNFLSKMPLTTSSFRFVCSSQFIGDRMAVIEVLKILQKEYQGFVDQEAWNDCIAEDKIEAVIDHKCKLFLNMTNVNESELTYHNNQLYLNECETCPYSIHLGELKATHLMEY